jgi:hypothetical protein
MTTVMANATMAAILPPLVSQQPLTPALTQNNNYANVVYVEHLAWSWMELHHCRTGRGMQHKARIKRVAIAERMSKMEEEQMCGRQGVCAH